MTMAARYFSDLARALASGVFALLICGVAPALAASPQPATPLPSDIKIGVTDTSGWIYTDRNGHTLYTLRGDPSMQSNCTDERFIRAAGGESDIPYYLPDADKRPTCVKFSPPLLAGAKARPVGDWTPFERPEGARQWAYQGRPVYRSSLDKAPGEVNGGGFFTLLGGSANNSHVPIRADMAGFPPGVTTKVTAAGTILMAGIDKPLFVRDGAGLEKASAGCGADCRTGWKPYLAPTLATPSGDWSVMAIARGMNQWAYKGRPLFTYDRVVLDPQVPLDAIPGWAPAVVVPLPDPPKGVTVQMTIEGPAYADAEGHTLYTFHCIDETPDRLECDVQGTTQQVRISLCGGLEQCRQWFKPLYAKKGDKTTNRTWAVVKIDPVTLGRMYDETKPGLYAWAHRGRPVYTFYLDKVPGDAYAHEIQLHQSADWRLIQVGTR